MNIIYYTPFTLLQYYMLCYIIFTIIYNISNTRIYKKTVILQIAIHSHHYFLSEAFSGNTKCSV